MKTGSKIWRTDPEYSVPKRLFSSPEVTADREAALEKLRRNEEIQPWETKLLNTFPDAYEGCLRENEARNEGARLRLQNKVTSALSEAGIEFSEDEEIRFEVWGYFDMKVTGNVSDDKLELIKETLADYTHDLQYIYQINGHRDEVEAGGLALPYLQSAEKILKEEGGGSVFDIGKDGSGNFTGLPGDLGEFIKEYAIGKFGVSSTDPYYVKNEEKIKKALFMREVFNSAVKTVKNGDYDRLRSMRTCLHKPSARLCDNLLSLPALKILEIRQYSCGFLPCHRQNLAANPHTSLVKTGSDLQSHI